MTHLPLRGALAPLTMPGKAASSLLNGLLRYYQLDEASGTRVDIVGGLNLTDNNTVTQAVGKIANAGQFTAANSEWLSGSDASLSFSGVDFTVSAWVYSDALAGGDAADGRGIVSVHNSDSIGDWHIAVRPTGLVCFSHWKTAGNDTTGRHITGSAAVADAAFYHIVCRRTSGVYTIRVNDVNFGLAGDTGTASGWTTTDFNVGRIFTSPASYFWNGRIDELGIWNRSLSAAEVTSLYNAGAGLTYPF